ncbi:hypothetical protein [Catenibacterium faecis]|mgnify:FL=1|uniref:Lipid A core - O-antigen ligase and related enzymes n=1 Tax=Catenibacterium faecis TaxID=2764323 RepID=A0ABR7K9C8_9FIRM|nr:hypothetical protein [Catenibacterium faecis]MBC6009314.1 hypothetical protein [Catenibacterium faecis]MBD9121916.1 hypothetical protein [Catenibacterium mitsuokai]
MINKVKTFIQKLTTTQMGLVVLAIYYFTLFLDITTLSYSFSKAATLCKLLRYVCYVYFLFVIYKKLRTLDLKSYINKIKNFDKKQYFVAGVVILALFSIVMNLLLTKNKAWVFLLFTLIYASCFDFEDVLNTIFSAQFISLILITTLSSFGLMHDYVNMRADGTMRHSLGFGYPTYLSQFLLFMILYYSYKKNFKISPEKLGLYQLLIVFSYFLTDSRTEMLISECILIGIFMNSVGILDKFKNVVEFFKKAYATCFPLFPIGSYILVMLYGFIFNTMNVNSIIFKIAQKFNHIFSNRLYQTFYDFKRYGLSLFGSNIDLVGYFLTKENEGTIIRSNFIDNEYMRILFENGWIFFIAFFAIISIVIWHLYKTKKDGLLFVSFVITTSSLINPRLFTITVSVISFMIIPVLHDLLFNQGGHLDE